MVNTTSKTLLKIFLEHNVLGEKRGYSSHLTGMSNSDDHPEYFVLRPRTGLQGFNAYHKKLFLQAVQAGEFEGLPLVVKDGRVGFAMESDKLMKEGLDQLNSKEEAVVFLLKLLLKNKERKLPQAQVLAAALTSLTQKFKEDDISAMYDQINLEGDEGMRDFFHTIHNIPEPSPLDEEDRRALERVHEFAINLPNMPPEVTGPQLFQPDEPIKKKRKANIAFG